jgi:hypothetical protein
MQSSTNNATPATSLGLNPLPFTPTVDYRFSEKRQFSTNGLTRQRPLFITVCRRRACFSTFDLAFHIAFCPLRPLRFYYIPFCQHLSISTILLVSFFFSFFPTVWSEALEDFLSGFWSFYFLIFLFPCYFVRLSYCTLRKRQSWMSSFLFKGRYGVLPLFIYLFLLPPISL